MSSLVQVLREGQCAGRERSGWTRCRKNSKAGTSASTCPRDWASFRGQSAFVASAAPVSASAGSSAPDRHQLWLGAQSHTWCHSTSPQALRGASHRLRRQPLHRSVAWEISHSQEGRAGALGNSVSPPTLQHPPTLSRFLMTLAHFRELGSSPIKITHEPRTPPLPSCVPPLRLVPCAHAHSEGFLVLHLRASSTKASKIAADCCQGRGLQHSLCFQW